MAKHKLQSNFSTPIVQRRREREAGEQKTTAPSNQQLKIARKATFAEVNALSSNQSHSGHTHVNANPTLETKGNSSLPYSQQSNFLRISRKATIVSANTSNLEARGEDKSKSAKSHNLPLAKANSQLPASTVQTKADTSINSQSLVTQLESKNQLKTWNDAMK